MKICILTQPLVNNYGGILQNYALQTTLKNLGHTVWTEDRKVNKKVLFDVFKQNKLVRQLFRKEVVDYSKQPSKTQQQIINKNITPFIERYIKCTEPIDSTNKYKLLKYGFEAYIVGSDQVWRPKYSYGLYNYFLDFTKNMNVLRIAYAASFGVDEWEFNWFQTLRCKHLINKFDAVSVREKSGVELCDKKWKQTAEHVLDPTMLLTCDEYKQLVKQTDSIDNREGIAVYVLDNDKEKNRTIQEVSNFLGKSHYSLMPKYKYENNVDMSLCVYDSIESWLKGLIDADFVVTDSFHGTVFSILFNKKFVSLTNKARGNARLMSLLDMFGLQDRLLCAADEQLNEVLMKDINYDLINKQIEQWRSESIRFIVNNLEKTN